jgi:hypothetical protein
MILGDKPLIFEVVLSQDWIVLIIRCDNIYVKDFAGCYELTEPAVQGVSDMSSHDRLFSANFSFLGT